MPKRIPEADRRQLKEFASLLRRRLRTAGLSTKRLAERSGVSQETIRSYMQARNRPSKGSMRRLQNVLGQDLAQPFAETELSGADDSGFVFISTDGIHATIELPRVSMSIKSAIAIHDILRREGILGDQVNDKSDTEYTASDR